MLELFCLMKRDEVMPLIRKCGCLPLKTGCLLVCVLSTLACIANIVAGAWHLPSHHKRDPEDNLISLSMIMFSSLSAVSNAIALAGIFLKRPGYLHLSLTSNCVFIICIFVVAMVTCAFRMEGFVKQPLHVLLIVLLLSAGADVRVSSQEKKVRPLQYLFSAFTLAYSVLYLMVVNSYYRTMKMGYGESAIPI